MNPLEELRNRIPSIEALLNYRFQQQKLLETAFIHRSFINEFRGEPLEHNERLEFLGDSILNLLIADYLYKKGPNLTEGTLSHLRSSLVDATSCAKYLKQLALEPFLLLGKGERQNSGRGRETLLANLFEALVGAIYLDGGFPAAQDFIVRHFSRSLLSALVESPSCNWKAKLQEHVQKRQDPPLKYETVGEIGPEHDKSFTIVVKIGDLEVGRGVGSSKKEAQQTAAADACERMGLLKK